MCVGKYPTKTELEEVFELRGSELWRKSDQWGRSKLVINKANHNGYCRVRFKKRMVLYHAIIWILNNGDIPDGLIIDHVNGDKLNNNIEKIRLVTNRENCNNKIEHRNGRLQGCYFHKRDKKWRAQIRLNKSLNHVNLGYYPTEQEGHEMYLFVKEKIDTLLTKEQVQDYARTHKNCTLRKTN